MASRKVDINDLVTLDMIAKRFHMSVAHTSNIVCNRYQKRGRAFPQPLKGKGTRAVWLWPDVKTWYDEVRPHETEAQRKAAKQLKKQKDKYVRNNFQLPAA